MNTGPHPGQKKRLFQSSDVVSILHLLSLFLGACSENNLAVVHLCEKSNIDKLNRLLAVIGSNIQKTHHGAVVPDRATWHRSKDLKIPSNLSLLHLPSYSPELNPLENVYDYLKSNFFFNRVFETLEDIKTHTRKAWQAFVDDPNLMKSIMHRKWAVAPILEIQISVI